MIDHTFWKGKKIFITGNTGFKGAWLCLWLHSLGADIIGYSLDPPTNPSLYELAHVKKFTNTVIGDIRDFKHLYSVMQNTNPDIIFHLAAQPIVRTSYVNPIETYETNVLGTVNVFEAVRNLSKNSYKKRVIVNVTSDKCYDNKEWLWGYRENDQMGGFDPYSNSKACSELVTSCYLQAFFNTKAYDRYGVTLASVRAGNVIGGGDFTKDRLIPDCIETFLEKKEITLRNPHAVRPWQHVLEPLSGYILLAEKLYTEGPPYQGGWNFGPSYQDMISVQKVVEKMFDKWGEAISIKLLEGDHPHEAQLLKLDCSKAKQLLHWVPKWNIDQALDKVVEWTKAYLEQQDIQKVCLRHITEYNSETRSPLSP